MTYSPPPGNVTGIVDIFSWVNNSLVNDFFFPGILLAIFVIIVAKLLFSPASDGSIARAFGSASFVCMILSILLRITNLIHTNIMVIFIIASAISLVWMHMENL